ncbi:MAG: PAS domain-containing protein [Desulfovibrionaceae bacterium]
MRNDDSHTGRSRTIPTKDLKSFVDDFPALLWRIERAKSRIEFLNDHPLHPVGDSARMLLKSKDFRHTLLLPEDRHLLDAFFDAVREGRTMATVFRVRTASGGVVWLKLTGAPNSYDPRYYYGYLLDISDTVALVQSMPDQNNTLRLRIENIPTPVILVNHMTRRLKQANAAAQELFGLPVSFNGTPPLLDALYPSSASLVMNRIMDDIVFEQSWSGTLEFRTMDGAPMEADATLRYIGWRKRPLVRLSVIPVAGKAARPGDAPAPSPAIPAHGGTTDEAFAARIMKAPDIQTMLETVMRHPLIAARCDAVMLSDIHERKNKVFVHGAGAPLENMAQGEEYSYKGTIAESIVRFDLDHLAVDDTMDSIKPIDWALFIPRGIRSYFAKPYYERKQLRSVLILCATRPNQFADCASSAFDAVLGTLHKASRAWFKTHRAR